MTMCVICLWKFSCCNFHWDQISYIHTQKERTYDMTVDIKCSTAQLHTKWMQGEMRKCIALHESKLLEHDVGDGICMYMIHVQSLIIIE